MRPHPLFSPSPCQGEVDRGMNQAVHARGGEVSMGCQERRAANLQTVLVIL